MNDTFRRNRDIAEALDACRSLREKIESLALDAEILRRVRDADCVGEMLAMLRHRVRSAGSSLALDSSGQEASFDDEFAAIRLACSRYDLSSLDDEEAEILRLARSTRTRLETLDAAGLAVRQRAVKARDQAPDLSPAEIAALSDFSDPWRLGAAD